VYAEATGEGKGGENKTEVWRKTKRRERCGSHEKGKKDIGEGSIILKAKGDGRCF